MGKKNQSSVEVIAKNSPMKAPCVNEHMSIDIRAIDNGFVTTESSFKGSDYVSRETFSTTKPQIEAVRLKEPRQNTLRDAVKSLK